MSPSTPSIYNATDGPLAIDRAGRQLGAGEERPVGDLDVEASPLSGHIAAERIALTGTDSAQLEPELDAEPTTSTRTRKGARTQEA